MKSISPRMFVLALLMFAGAGLALAMRPTHKIADTREPTDLNAMIPQQFGAWKIDTSIVPIESTPDVQAKLDKIYNQTLSRTYVNRVGQQIMLAIAYNDGKKYESLNTHRPEICYTAQGFDLLKVAVGQLITQYGALPVMRLLTQQRTRVEPITYWVIVGDKVTFFGLPHKIAHLRYGLASKIADGMLVRVSSIDRDENGAYQLHQEFLDAMLAGMSETDRLRIIGHFGA